MHAMLSNDYKRKLCCMAAGAPAAFQSENTRVRPPSIDVFHVRSSSTARHTKCNSWQTRRGSASPQSAHTSSYYCVLILLESVGLTSESVLFLPYKSQTAMWSKARTPCHVYMVRSTRSCGGCRACKQSWQWFSGSWVLGQMGQQIWLGHVGHGQCPWPVDQWLS